MAEELPDPWRSVVEITESAAADRAAQPELDARLAAAASRFGTTGTGVAALLDDVDRRANIDVDAPLDSSRPVVPHLKGAVRKAGAFVARHLAQQTTVLVGGLSAAVRELDQRVRHLEHDGHETVIARVPDVRARVATVLGSLESRCPGTRRDAGTSAELTTLPAPTQPSWSATGWSTSGPCPPGSTPSTTWSPRLPPEGGSRSSRSLRRLGLASWTPSSGTWPGQGRCTPRPGRTCSRRAAVTTCRCTRPRAFT